MGVATLAAESLVSVVLVGEQHRSGYDELAHLRLQHEARLVGTTSALYFWSEALDWPLVWDQDEETAIGAPDGTGPFITWGGRRSPRRWGRTACISMSRWSTTSIRVEAEVERLVSLGAIRLGPDPDDIGGVAMVDPDGNEFRVLRPR